MPIARERRKLYLGGSIRSLAWRTGVREPVLVRAGYRCEGTTQWPECRAIDGRPHPETGSDVVLTVAHLDQNPENNDPENLRALCQRCHVQWDSMASTRKAIATRARKLGEGTLDLFICEALP